MKRVQMAQVSYFGAFQAVVLCLVTTFYFANHGAAFSHLILYFIVFLQNVTVTLKFLILFKKYLVAY